MNLIFDNCVEYNGADSEYAELAEEMKKMFQQLSKKHFAGEEEEPVKKRKKRESRSPSACKTPELTSESSEEESDSGRSEVTLIGANPKIFSVLYLEL